MVFLISGCKAGGLITKTPRLGPAAAAAKAEELIDEGYADVHVQTPDGRRLKLSEFQANYELTSDRV